MEMFLSQTWQSAGFHFILYMWDFSCAFKIAFFQNFQGFQDYDATSMQNQMNGEREPQ